MSSRALDELEKEGASGGPGLWKPLMTSISPCRSHVPRA
jgi:hypothetical protein